jgi:hypothetical protein
MAYVKRRKQPHLFRDPSIDPTKQVRLQLEAQQVESSAPAPVVVSAAKKSTRKRAKTVKH